MQNLGIHPDAVTANIRSSLNTFMPQGNLAALLEGESIEPPVLVATNSPKQPVTVTPDNYRLPLLSGMRPEVCPLFPPAACSNQLRKCVAMQSYPCNILVNDWLDCWTAQLANHAICLMHESGLHF